MLVSNASFQLLCYDYLYTSKLYYTIPLIQMLVSTALLQLLCYDYTYTSKLYYTRSPLEDSRLFGPSPWKVLATTYDKKNISEQPSPWRKSCKRESCYGDREYTSKMFGLTILSVKNGRKILRAQPRVFHFLLDSRSINYYTIGTSRFPLPPRGFYATRIYTPPPINVYSVYLK